MSQVNGKNVVLYQQGEDTAISIDVTDNMDGTQTVEVTWGEKPPGTLATLIGYNDGSWHDSPVVGTSSGSIIIPTGSYTYRLKFTRIAPYSILTYSPLPTTITTWKPYACARSVSRNKTRDFIETSVSGSGTTRTFKPTASSWNMSFEGVVFLDMEGMLTYEDLSLAWDAAERLYLKYEMIDEDGNEFSEYGHAYVADLTDNGTYNDIANYSVEFKGTGPLTQAES